MNKSILAIAVASLTTHASISYAEQQVDETMVVTANRFSQPDAAILAQAVVLTKEDIDKLQATSLVDVFRTLPSVEVAQYGGRGQSASIYVRGGSANQVLILVDGVRMPKSMMGGVDFNQFPVNGIERIEFIRGARASIYGSEAIAGVVNIITQADINSSKSSVRAGFGSNDLYLGSVSVAKSLDNDNHIKAVVCYEVADGFNVKPVEGVNDGDEHGFQSYNLHLAYQQQFNQNWFGYIASTMYNNEYEYDNSFAADPIWGTPASHEKKVGEVEYKGVNGKLAYQKDELNSELALSLSTQDNYNYIAGQGRKDTKNVTSVEQTYLSWLTGYQVNSDFDLGVGVDYRHEKLKEAYDSSETPYTPSENPRKNLGLNIVGQYSLNNWTIEGSARSDDNSQYGRHNTWQSAAGWEFISGYELIASYGTAFRAPTFTDLYYPGSEAPDLQPETSKNAEVSLRGSTSIVEWSLTGYQNKIDNMLLWEPDYPGAWTGKMNNIGRAEIQGVELALDFDTSVISHQIYLDYKEPLDKSDGKEEQLQYRAKKGLKWNAMMDLGDWSLGTQYLYQGDRYAYNGQLPSYSLWNLTADYQVMSDLLLQGKINNLFNKDYEMYQGYSSPERNFMVSATYQF